jgi:hypothetical protein
VSFADHFSGVSAGYAAYRPHYPDELFDFLAAAAPARDTAWDAALVGPGGGGVGAGIRACDRYLI